MFNTMWSNESSIVLTEEQRDNNQIILWYQNRVFALGKGDAAAMGILGNVIRELVLDENLKERFKKYTKLHRQLGTDDMINELRNQIDFVHEYIHGGKPLGGLGACDLCYPPGITP
jgi:hypothetical protein